MARMALTPNYLAAAVTGGFGGSWAGRETGRRHERICVRRRKEPEKGSCSVSGRESRGGICRRGSAGERRSANGHRCWSADGTRYRILQTVQAEAEGRVGWSMTGVDSTPLCPPARRRRPQEDSADTEKRSVPPQYRPGKGLGRHRIAMTRYAC